MEIQQRNSQHWPSDGGHSLFFFDIPCFFSRAELEVFLGYKSPNHNVDGAFTKMVEEHMLVKATNKVGTEIYYLGNFGMKALGRHTLPDLDTRQVKYIESITIRLENGQRVINSRNRATRDKIQEPSTSKKNTITPSAKKSKPNPKAHLFKSDKESSKSTIESPSKESTVEKEVVVIDDKSSSDEESEKSEDSVTPTQQQEKKAASRKDNPLAFMNQDLFEPTANV
jgi:hypothetical protein